MRYPQPNGAIEVVHKKLITKIALEKANHKEINIHNIITECLEAHNNKIHSATLYTPMDLKNITDQNVISEVIENINKSMERKIKKEEILELGDKLLLVNKCYLDKSNNKLKKKKYSTKNL